MFQVMAMANVVYQPAALSCSGCRHRRVACGHVPPPCETCSIQLESWGDLCRHQIGCGPRDADWGVPQTPAEEARSEERHVRAREQHGREREAHCAAVCARRDRHQEQVRRAYGLPTAETSPVQAGAHQGMVHCERREARMAERRERQRVWQQRQESRE